MLSSFCPYLPGLLVLDRGLSQASLQKQLYQVQPVTRHTFVSYRITVDEGRQTGVHQVFMALLYLRRYKPGIGQSFFRTPVAQAADD